MSNDGLIDVVATVFDSHLNAIYGDNGGPGLLLYFKNQGSRVFDDAIVLEEFVGCADIVVGDFDDDGCKDIPLVSRDTNQLWAIYNHLPRS